MLRFAVVAALLAMMVAASSVEARNLFARRMRQVPPACGECLLNKRADLIPFYTKNGWKATDRQKIIDDWCGKVAPDDCNKAKGQFCSAECGAAPVAGDPGGAPAAPSDGGGPAAILGAGSWSILPFQGDRSVWQAFGDTCFSRGQGAGYYKNTGKMHNGIDFGMPCGTPVYAVCDGTVFSAGGKPFGAGPQSVILQCGDKYALYGHLSGVSVQKGAAIKTGVKVGNSGTPDSPSNCHLHFEVRPASSAHPTVVINPATCFSAAQKGFFDKHLAGAKICSNVAAQQYDMARPPAKPANCAVRC